MGDNFKINMKFSAVKFELSLQFLKSIVELKKSKTEECLIYKHPQWLRCLQTQ